MPLEPNPIEDFSPYYLKAKALTKEHDFTVLIGDRKFKEAGDNLHKAAVALEKASVLLIRMAIRKAQNETKRDI